MVFNEIFSGFTTHSVAAAELMQRESNNAVVGPKSHWGWFCMEPFDNAVMCTESSANFGIRIMLTLFECALFEITCTVSGA